MARVFFARGARGALVERIHTRLRGEGTTQEFSTEPAAEGRSGGVRLFQTGAALEPTGKVDEDTCPSASERQARIDVANAVADDARPTFRDDVRARKLTIASGVGRVHGEFFGLAKWGVDEYTWNQASANSSRRVVSKGRWSDSIFRETRLFRRPQRRRHEGS